MPLIWSLKQDLVFPCVLENAESIADGVRKFLKMSQQELNTMEEYSTSKNCLWKSGARRLAEMLESAVQHPRGCDKWPHAIP